MKTGRSIQDLAAEIARQATTKKDFVAQTEVMKMNYDLRGRPHPEDGADRHNPNFGKMLLTLGDKGDYPVNAVAHGQIGDHVKIPKPYYDRMLRDAPDLLATNVDRWFGKYPAPRMVRTLDGTVRAFLSSSYRPLDNADFAAAVLPIIGERKLEVMSCEITDRRLYIKAVDTALFRDVPVGHKMGDGTHTLFDTCAPAIILSNSEVGYGRLVVETGVYTRACTNLALFADGGMRRSHLGARHRLVEDVENIDHVLTDKTKKKTDEALWMQVRDVLAAAFDTARIGERLKLIEATSTRRIEGKVEKVVELAAKRFDLADGERESVLKHLIEGGSLTQYGLHAAVTRAAQDAPTYDRATELEYLGGRVVELPKNEWESMSLAA